MRYFVWLFTFNLFNFASQAAEITWASTYDSAYREALEKKAELFIYFEPTTPSNQSREFSEKTLNDDEIKRALEDRVNLKISTEQKQNDKEETKPLSENSFFKSPSIKKVGGWAIIDFSNSDKITLKCVYAFDPPTPQGVFSSWNKGNVLGILNGRLTGSDAAPAAAGNPGNGLEGQILELVNQYRAQNRKNVLSFDESLRFQDDGGHSTYYNRGYGLIGGAGAYGNKPTGGMTASEVVTMWKGSPAHNAQLLKDGVNRHAVYADGTNFNWVAIP